jgi:hypothetical protein
MSNEPITCKDPIVIKGANITVENAFHIVRVEEGCHVTIVDSSLTLVIAPGAKLRGDDAHPQRKTASAIDIVGGTVVVQRSTIRVQAQDVGGFTGHSAIHVASMANETDRGPIRLSIDDSRVFGSIGVSTKRATVKSERLVLDGVFHCAGAASLHFEDLVATRTAKEGDTFGSRCPLTLDNPTISATGGTALSVSAPLGPVTIRGGKISSDEYVGLDVGRGEHPITVTGVAVKGAKRAMVARSAQVTFKGGSVTATGGNFPTAIFVRGKATTVSIHSATLAGEAKVENEAVLELRSVTLDSPKSGLTAERKGRLEATECTVKAGSDGASATREGHIVLVGGSVRGTKHRLSVQRDGHITVRGTKLEGGPISNDGGAVKLD